MGVGVPNEYFHPDHVARFSTRVNMSHHDVFRKPSQYYRELIKLRTTVSACGKSVFGIKIQPWQVRWFHVNRDYWYHEARPVFLFREDKKAQALSFKKAWETGVWGFDGAETTHKMHVTLDSALQGIAAEEEHWKRYFDESWNSRLLKISYEQLIENTDRTIRTVCSTVGVDFDGDRLRQYLDIENPAKVMA